MKTVLVLTLLAVTIACCYARHVEHDNEPSWASGQSSHPQRPKYPGKWLPQTIACNVLNNELFFYILGIKESKIEVDCFLAEPDCVGPLRRARGRDVCCFYFHGMSYHEEGEWQCHRCWLPYLWSKMHAVTYACMCSWSICNHEYTVHLNCQHKNIPMQTAYTEIIDKCMQQ